MTGLVRMLANLFTRTKLQYAKRGTGTRRKQQTQAVQRHAAARCFGRKEIDSVQFATRYCLEHRKERTQRFAYPSRRLGKQAAAVQRGFVDGFRELALPVTQRRERKSEGCECLVPVCAVLCFADCPTGKLFT